jgi:hypothetical protein
MPGLLAAKRPPLLLADHGVLIPGSPKFRQLRETDKRLIRDSYVEYWGPVRVAGTALVIPSGGVVPARLPFAGTYRIESEAAILVDGQRHDPGDRMEWRADSKDASIQTLVPNPVAIRVRIIWDAAQDPPSDPPPEQQLYSRL